MTDGGTNNLSLYKNHIILKL